jgi:hypothetical protein
LNNTDGFNNTATGAFALSSNTTGPANTATGANALSSNTIGCCNTADGVNALSSNTSGGGNTASGLGSLVSNTTGDSNTANGANALSSNTTGFNNTASGALALEHNTTGSDNTATGSAALNSSTGSQNTAIGFHALLNSTTGSKNIALGFRAGSDLTTGGNNIDIGNAGQAGESSTIRIGRVEDHTATYIAGIAGATVPTGVTVIVNAYGRLGTVVSSERFKDAIKPMDKASEAILALRPVTFRYKHELDPAGIPQFGLVAEQVEKVNPDLVARDADGKAYTVRYDAVNAMLLNEFLKARRQIDAQQKQIDALTAGLQKVTAQVEMSRPASQMVLNKH